MKTLLRLFALLALLSVATVAARLGFDALVTAPGPASSVTTVLLPRHSSSADIGARLASAGVIAHAGWWPLLVRLSGRQPLLAGEYALPAHASVASVLDMLRRGQVVVHRLTIAEGLTVLQSLDLLRQAYGVTLPPTVTPAEGSLLPDTYFYVYGDSADDLLGRMQRGMTEFLQTAWGNRQPDPHLPDKASALVLASIIERETALADERPHIAAVFLNRLKEHMRLQSDPTVIYAVSHGQGVLARPLSRADLAAASPFNSYLSDGLPPTPICNPGRASVMAALHPADSDDLYFVADGSGGHIFARSLAEHNRNVLRLRQIEQGTPSEGETRRR